MLAPKETWTSERVERLRELCAAGWSAGRIAADLGGVTRDAVIGKSWRMDLPRKRGRRAHDALTLPRPRQQQNGGRPRKPRGKKLNTKPQSITVPSLWVRFIDLEPHHCRWPAEDRGDDGLMLFCGTAKVDGCSYCAKHQRIVYARRVS